MLLWMKVKVRRFYDMSENPGLRHRHDGGVEGSVIKYLDA